MQEGGEQARQQDQPELSILTDKYRQHYLWWRTDQTTCSMLSNYNRYLVNEQKEILINYPTALLGLLGYPARLKPTWSSIKGLLAERDHSWVCPYKRCLHHLCCRRCLHLHSVTQNFLKKQTFTSVDLCHHYTPVKSSSSLGQSLLSRSPTASSHDSASKSYLDHRICNYSILFSFSSSKSFLQFYSNLCWMPTRERGPDLLVLPQTYSWGPAWSDHLHTGYRLGPGDLPNSVTT